MKVIDTRGLTCPAPLIKTRQGLTEAAENEAIQIIIDNQTSFNNVKRYLTDNKLTFTVTERNNIYTVTATRGDQSATPAGVNEYCATTASADKGRRVTVVAITSDRMGQGDDELGAKLMLSFFKMLVMLEPSPSSVVFYNSGVKLAAKESPVLEFINDLHEKGTGIYLCTTCLNHFGLKDQIPVGAFSDMYQILNLLNDAGHIIRP